MGKAAVGSGPVPFGSELFRQGRGAPVVLKKEAIFTGQQLTGAAATFDENQQPAGPGILQAIDRHEPDFILTWRLPPRHAPALEVWLAGRQGVREIPLQIPSPTRLFDLRRPPQP